MKDNKKMGIGDGTSFIANAEVLQAFNVQKLETAKRLSDRMGDQTITFVTQTHSSGDTMSRTVPTFYRDSHRSAFVEKSTA